MNGQKYHVGQIVHFAEPEVKRGAPRGDHRVERFLPPDAGEYQYRVKGLESGRERVARESQLGGQMAVETLAQSLYEAENATKVPWSQRDRTIRAPWLKEALHQLASPEKV
ncbi:hypothetical protein D3877_13755 [Azospirillum cavernae]|uniref:Uncharacterized protein n=1 Tax=Azospirillum cavernae TaxID=2320860 RepID=A0A418VVT8_9PROT|nr:MULTISPECIES: hypothetical protein [Azospirillum]RJF81254.1 hypothetical protein D3877_13755 [Azospirillum cavernae]